mgnify:CR=1 FL=1
MKKILKLFLFISIFSLVGCSTKSSDNILEKLEKKLENANSYYLEGIMEIMNNEDTYTYDVKVSYQKQDYYRIELVNTLNNHNFSSIICLIYCFKAGVINKSGSEIQISSKTLIPFRYSSF